MSDAIDTIDTSAEAVEAIAKRLKRDIDWRPGSLCEQAATALRALVAERDAALAEAARLREAHAENARLLGLLVNDLQGRIEGGKLAALAQCWERAALAKEAGDAG